MNCQSDPIVVMAGLDPAIHAAESARRLGIRADVDGRDDARP